MIILITELLQHVVKLLLYWYSSTRVDRGLGVQPPTSSTPSTSSLRGGEGKEGEDPPLLFWQLEHCGTAIKMLACVRWHNCASTFFTIGIGTRLGEVLSPLMFTRYINKFLLNLWVLGLAEWWWISACWCHCITIARSTAWRQAMKRLRFAMWSQYGMECGQNCRPVHEFFSS